MDANGTKTNTRAPLALLLISLGCAALHGYWFARDNRVPFMDQHRYYEVAQDALRCLDGTENPAGLLVLEGSHPPLYPILGGLAMALTEESYGMARMVNVVLAPLLLLATYLLARRSLRPWGAVLAAVLAGFAPLTFSFGHVFYIEALLVPLVLFTWWWLDRSEGLERPRAWVPLGILVGLGCLAKWTYPVFVVAPIVLAASRRERLRAFAGAACIAALIAGPWYVVNASEIVAFFARGVTGGEGHLSARSGLAGWLYYPKELVLVGLGIPLSLAVGAGFLSRLRTDRTDLAWWLTLALFPVVVFSLVLTKKPRHLLPVIPVFTILAAHALVAIRSRPRAVIVGVLIGGHVLAAATQASFRWIEPDPIIRLLGRKVPLLSEPSPIPGAPRSPRWPYEAIVDVLEDVGARAEAPALLAFNLPSFREDGFWYTRDRLQRDVSIGLIPFAWPKGHPAATPFPLARVDVDTPGLLDAETIVVKTGRMWVRYGSRLPLHGFGAMLTDALLAPHPELGKAFEEHARVPCPDGSSVVVFRRSGLEQGERKRAIARWVLAFDPDHVDAWRALEEPMPPSDAQRRLRAADLDLTPTDGPPTAVEGDHAGWRLDRDSGDAALRLADASSGAARLWWLRRCLAADRNLAPQVRERLAATSSEVPANEADLADALARLTAGTRPPHRR